ncbi:MAG: UDP-glucose--hexose-1-phosphate uridylyltransferase [Coriobacteriia bacterium]|nr:UDP-glucose--hexose-1-phosphate uridylyltransferase [Coriobacteriia bacterium]
MARAETAASQAVDQLLAYALRVQLLGEADATWARNGLLALVGLDAPAGDAGAPAAAGQAPVPACDDPDFYTHQLAEAARCLGVLPAGRAEEESFAAHAMNMLMPRPSEVAAVFGALQGTPDAACSYLYRVSCHSGYVHAHAAARDIKWTTHTAWGPLEITINRSKPEKDPRAIAAAAAKPAGDALGEAYPACQLCLSNEGYAGRAPGNAAGTHPARQNLRIAPITLGGQPWGLQFSPYSYYEQHCIVINREHTPMHVDRQAFENLLEFTDQFPQYFIGSNADLPLVGGSILTHDHYQAGLHTFPMERAGVASTFDVPGFSGVQGAVLRWPLSVLRLTGDNAQELARAASYVLDCWRAYSDVSVGVLAESEGVPHNTITPIARKTAGTAGAGDSYTLYLVLRCNVTSAKRPFGRFHPREELHHIKKENIGLIEVMGLAILPGRLAEELQVVEEALAEGDPAAVRAQLEANPAAAKHAPWAEELAASVIPSEAGPTAQQPVDLHLYVQDAVGAVFAAVLEDAGVFKWDPAGRAAQQRFLDTL